MSSATACAVCPSTEAVIAAPSRNVIPGEVAFTVDIRSPASETLDAIDGDLRGRGFSPKTGYYLACASKSAYEEHSDWIEKLGPGHRITFFTCGQFRGLVALLEKVVLLAFRGTKNIGNCLTDADTLFVSKSPYPGRVHSGFVQAIVHLKTSRPESRYHTPSEPKNRVVMSPET